METDDQDLNFQTIASETIENQEKTWMPPPRSWAVLNSCIPDLESVDLLGPVITLGRSELSDIVLNHSFKVSKEHFYLTRSDNCTVYLIDISKNGTFVNGKPVSKTLLHDEDIISVGEPSFKIFKFKLNISCCEEKSCEILPEIITNQFVIGGEITYESCKLVKLAFGKFDSRTYVLKKLMKDKYKCNLNLLIPLKHEFLLDIFVSAETASEIILISRYFRGEDLTSFIRNLKLYDIKLILYQILVALGYLHQNGVIHRNLKPKNVLIEVKNDIPMVKISDFGLNEMVDGQILTGVFRGLPSFLAPELLDAHSFRFNEKVDIWSLGGILFYMVFKRLPLIQLDGNFQFPLFNTRNQSNNDFAELMRGMLMIDPNARISIDEILENPWLEKPLMQAQIEQNLYNYEGGEQFEPSLKRRKLDYFQF